MSQSVAALQVVLVLMCLGLLSAYLLWVEKMVQDQRKWKSQEPWQLESRRAQEESLRRLVELDQQDKESDR